MEDQKLEVKEVVVRVLAVEEVSVATAVVEGIRWGLTYDQAREVVDLIPNQEAEDQAREVVEREE